ncbi:unnamed protein product [Mucor hiemalis]
MDSISASQTRSTKTNISTFFKKEEISSQKENREETRTKVKAEDESSVAVKVEDDCDIKKSLSESSNQSSQNQKYSCSVCNKIFERKSSLTNHNKIHSKKACLICKKIFSSNQALRRHRVENHMPKSELPYACSVCDKRYIRKFSLELHRKTHLPKSEWLYVCSICDKRFHRKPSLEEHEQVHIPISERSNKLKCDVCGGIFSSTKTLNNHNRRFHSPEYKKTLYPRSLGGKAFASKYGVRRHSRKD